MSLPQQPAAHTPLRGQVALVTGGGTGIGAAAARAFAARGAMVVVVGRRRAELEAVAAQIEQSGGRALAMPADVTDEHSVRDLVEAIVERCGRLDAAFNNAGMLGAMKPIVDLQASDFDAVMAVNLRAVWLLLKYEVAAMLKTGRGAIVNTTSFVAQAATPGMSIYAASKAALEAMIRAVALEVGPSGIRVNNVAPGVIRTPMSVGLDPSFYAALGAHAALKRLGEPADVGDVAVWLCSDEARFITGQTILVDGGFTIPGLR